MHSNFQSFNPAAVGHKHMTCSITPGTLCAVLYTYLQLFTFLCANFRQFLWCCRDVRQGISTVNGHSDKLSKLMLSKLLHHKCFCTQWKTYQSAGYSCTKHYVQRTLLGTMSPPECIATKFPFQCADVNEDFCPDLSSGFLASSRYLTSKRSYRYWAMRSQRSFSASEAPSGPVTGRR